MRRYRRFAPTLAILACLLAPLPAAASGFGLFQHGGRAMGQVGALTARAPDASAVFYNPAALVRLQGSQYQAGLDLNNASDELTHEDGRFNAKHVINFPPALYAAWRPQRGRWALGLGLDAPFWYTQNWEPALFPARFQTRLFALEVFELHPVLAVELSDSWSLGGGLRYLYGTLEQGRNVDVFLFTPQGDFRTEGEVDADSDVDALAWDLALHYARPAWGWGAVLRSAADLEGDGDFDTRVRNVPAGFPEPEIRGSVSQSFELPYELRGGVWIAPYPELRIELDAAYQRWSDLDDTEVTFRTGGLTITDVTRRDWDDTLSLRLGLEGDVTDAFALFGGVAWEPSPVPDRTREAGLPRGDAMVYSAGFGYNFPHISFDVGYSFHDHDTAHAAGRPAGPGPIRPTRGDYDAKDQVWGFGVRWRR